MTSAKIKLENLAEKGKVRLQNKIKEDKNKVVKLKEFLEYDEYERNQRLLAEKNKSINATKKLEKIDKEIEKK